MGTTRCSHPGEIFPLMREKILDMLYQTEVREVVLLQVL